MPRAGTTTINTDTPLHNFAKNGAMELATKGGSASGVTNAYLVDSWKTIVDQGGTGLVLGIVHSTLTPTKTEAGWPVERSFDAGNQVGVATLTGQEFLAIGQSFEGYELRKFFGKTVSFGWWHLCDVAGPFALNLIQRNGSSGAGYTIQFEYTTPGVWQFIEVNNVFIDPSILSTAPDSGNSEGFRIEIVIASGPNRKPLTGENQWETRTTGFFSRGTVGMANGIATTSTDTAITLFRMNEGPVVNRNFVRGEGTFQQLVESSRRYIRRQAYGTSFAGRVSVPLQPPMRSTPTVGTVSSGGTVFSTDNISPDVWTHSKDGNNNTYIVEFDANL